MIGGALGPSLKNIGTEEVIVEGEGSGEYPLSA
jgi:hypothetical protein